MPEGRDNPATKKRARKPAQSPIYPRIIDPKKTPASIPPVNTPLIFPRMCAGSSRMANELRQGKRNPCPQPDIRPDRIKMKLPSKKIKSKRPAPARKSVFGY